LTNRIRQLEEEFDADGNTSSRISKVKSFKHSGSG
jgi:hypothetical protein